MNLGRSWPNVLSKQYLEFRITSCIYLGLSFITLQDLFCVIICKIKIFEAHILYLVVRISFVINIQDKSFYLCFNFIQSSKGGAVISPIGIVLYMRTLLIAV
jgi:hypothetical protein